MSKKTVADKTENMNLQTIKSISIADIDVDEKHKGRVNDPEVKTLAADIEAHGLLQPVVVRIGEKPGRYQLIAGHRRIGALTLLGRETVLANVVMCEDDTRKLLLTVSENHFRANTSVVDDAANIAALKELGLSTAEVAAAYQASPVWVNRCEKIAELDSKTKRLLVAGKIGFDAAIALIRVREDKRSAIVDKLVETYDKPSIPASALIPDKPAGKTNKPAPAPGGKTNKPAAGKAGGRGVPAPIPTKAVLKAAAESVKEDKAEVGKKPLVRSLVAPGKSAILSFFSEYFTSVNEDARVKRVAEVIVEYMKGEADEPTTAKAIREVIKAGRG